jgi:tetratricopeptide (TPR) repeat protein
MAPARRLFLPLYAASGAAALVYEVARTRLLTLQLRHTGSPMPRREPGGRPTRARSCRRWSPARRRAARGDRGRRLVGSACATLGRRDCARAALDASLRANPRDASTYLNLGQFCLQSGSPQEAADYFAEALTVDPSSSAARDGLAQARSLLAANPR